MKVLWKPLNSWPMGGGGEGMVKDFGVSETSIPGFCWIREFGRYLLGCLDWSRNFGWYSIQSEGWCSRAWVCQLHSSTWLSIIKLLLLPFDNLMHSGYWVWARNFLGGEELVFGPGISSKAVSIFWVLIFCLFYYFALVEFTCICIFRFFFRKNFSWSPKNLPRAYFLAADLSATISSRH